MAAHFPGPSLTKSHSHSPLPSPPGASSSVQECPTVTAAKYDVGLVPIEQGSEAPSAGVNDSLIVWVAWNSQVFSLRAKKTSLLSF